MDTSGERTLSNSTGAAQRFNSRGKRQRQVEWLEDEHRGRRWRQPPGNGSAGYKGSRFSICLGQRLGSIERLLAFGEENRKCLRVTPRFCSSTWASGQYPQAETGWVPGAREIAGGDAGEGWDEGLGPLQRSPGWRKGDYSSGTGTCQGSGAGGLTQTAEEFPEATRKPLAGGLHLHSVSTRPPDRHAGARQPGLPRKG